MPLPQRPYTGAAVPTTYDPLWPTYTNLTPEQIAAFQSFPQDLSDYASQRRWMAELTGTSAQITPVGAQTAVTIPLITDDRSRVLVIGMRQALDAGMITQVSFKAAGDIHVLDAVGIKTVHGALLGFVDALFNAEAQAISGINDGTITTRAQIDALYAPISPNSPSALGQG